MSGKGLILGTLCPRDADVMVDWAQNLSRLAPDATILIHNSGTNWDWVAPVRDLNLPNVRFFHRACPLRYGKIHIGLFRMMAWAEENLDFDILTVADSDQFLLRPGFFSFVRAFLHDNPDVGLLSASNPFRVCFSRDAEFSHDTHPKAQVWAEWDAHWKPAYEAYPNGEDAFEMFSFGPSTTYTRSAIRGILRLYRSDQALRQAICSSRGNILEESIFPTLVALDGGRVVSTPCEQQWVVYGTRMELADLEAAQACPNAFWFHPVPHAAEHPIRSALRSSPDSHDAA